MASVEPLSDLGQLTDEELRAQLVGYGVSVGPIVSSTRLFYEKKLGKFIDGGGSPPPSQPDTESEEDDYEDEEEMADEEVQFNYKQPPVQQAMPSRPQPPVQPSMPSRPQPPVQQSMPSRPPVVTPRPQTATPHTPIMQPRRASPTRAASARHRPGAPLQAQMTQPRDKTADTKTPTNAGGIAMWIKLLFIIIVAFLVYLVIINMNPTTQNKIPMSIDDV